MDMGPCFSRAATVSPPPIPLQGSWGQRREDVKELDANVEFEAAFFVQMVADATVGNLIHAGLIRTPFRIEREYKGAPFTALVRPYGKVEFDGQVYDSLPTAAGMARKSVVGAPAGRPYQTGGCSAVT